MIIFDLETMGVESTSVVLSMGIVKFDPDKITSYQDILDSSLFLKLDAKEQMAVGRGYDEGTCKWWDRQSDIVKNTSLLPKEDDLKFAEYSLIFNTWCAENYTKGDVIWTRGGLDQLCSESLYRSFNSVSPLPYNKFYDVRTFIDLTYPSAKNGYVKVDPNKLPSWGDHLVIKHHPVHDAAFDAAMMLYGVED